MTALFWSLVLLLGVLFVLLAVADRRVARAASWEAVDTWLLIGSYAAPSTFIVAGAAVGVGLAWCVM